MSDKRDLVIERDIPVAPEKLWRGWTEPQHLMPWFCPKPWKTTACEIDLKAGGKFKTVMEGPDGTKMDNDPGCFLEVVPNRKLVWTSALGPGFRPVNAEGAPFLFTCVLSFEPNGKGGTKYTCTAVHKDEKSAESHAQMGFHAGWGAALDQLIEYAKNL